MSRIPLLRARTVGLLGLALLTALGGCSPIETYREWTGIAANDPNPATSPFVHNMAAAYDKPYPNLATVPPPPTTETSTAERQKLTQSLIADRQTAAHAAPAAPASALEMASSGAPPGAVLAARSGALAAVPAARSRDGSAPAHSPASPPQDSTLQMPQIASLPQPQAPRPAPPPPQLATIPPPTPAALPPAALASAAPSPPLPPPVLPPIAPPPPPPRLGKSETPAPAMPAPTVVARLDLPANAATGIEQAKIAHVARLYSQKPGSVRVVAYAAAPTPGGDPLAGYEAALGRARAVAKSLAAAGIPARKISTEAKPAAPGSGAAPGRIEIEFAP